MQIFADFQMVQKIIFFIDLRTSWKMENWKGFLQ